jgi:hypothetical protein
MDERTLCPFCGHTLVGNQHGLDQDDLIEGKDGSFLHRGYCTYCPICWGEYLTGEPAQKPEEPNAL